MLSRKTFGQLYTTTPSFIGLSKGKHTQLAVEASIYGMSYMKFFPTI